MTMPLSLVDHAKGELEELILKGRLKPGQRIGEQEVAGIIGISRPPLREALKLLEAEGLVVRIPRKGAFVVELTEKDIWEIYTLKSALFGAATELAMASPDGSWLDDLGACAEQMEVVARSDHPTVETYQDVHAAFHDIILEHAANDRLTRLASTLHRPVQIISLQSLADIDHLRSSCEYHRAIYEAMRADDVRQAVRLTHDHVMFALDRLLKMRSTDDPAFVGEHMNHRGQVLRAFSVD